MGNGLHEKGGTMMATFTVNDQDLTDKLRDFYVGCESCGSPKTEMEIDWAAYASCSWCNVTVRCVICGHEQSVYSVI
jgi:hypothetical protein